MTQVIIGEDYIEISGHAKEPVVCHGISAISQMVANYAEDNGWGYVDGNDGYLKIYDLNPSHMENDLFMAMINALEDIAIEYPGNIIIKYDPNT